MGIFLYLLLIFTPCVIYFIYRKKFTWIKYMPLLAIFSGTVYIHLLKNIDWVEALMANTFGVGVFCFALWIDREK